MTRRQTVALLLTAPWFGLLGASGCGGDPDQRKSGTLVVPLESVEKAGEISGQAEDARKKAKK